MSSDYKDQWNEYLTHITASLEASLAARHDTDEPFLEALRYSVLGGGKRIRPVLCLASCEAAGGNATDALPAGCALELIHAYSLVHDDMPCMDDDDERRGQPTVHRKYGEAIAVLAGDGLQAEAFRLVGDRRLWATNVSPEVQLQVVREVAQAAGIAGMVGGQFIDVSARENDLGVEQLRRLHRLKTGALIRAAAVCGGLIAGAAPLEIAALSQYGAAVGALFQLTDDLLDLIQSQEEGVGIDRADREAAVNFAVILGEDRLRAEVDQRLVEALDAVEVFAPKHQFLRSFAEQIANRKV